MEDLMVIRKRGREESDSDVSESPEVKRLREDLLDGLNDEGEVFEAGEDLDSFMKSFEDEITASCGGVDAAEVVGLTSNCGESRLDLGYLLDASDDELGLPPTTSSAVGFGSESRTELDRVESEPSGFEGEFWDFPSYDSFGLGFGETGTNEGICSGEYTAVDDGLFDYSDLNFGSGDFAYRPGTLPAQ